MEIQIFETKQAMGDAAARIGADAIRLRLSQTDSANIILATGASQFEMLNHLVQQDIDWSRVHCFHLDEYVGLSIEHPASFCRYLRERFVEQLDVPPASFHFIDGTADPAGECDRLSALISPVEIDVAFIGIGENGHLAFNDPPADFKTTVPYHVVTLDEQCRNQQLGEGWFESLEGVPKTAISMSVAQILKSNTIVCTVPDQRKAQAVAAAVEGPIKPDLPASALQNHRNTHLFLDTAAGSELSSGN